MKELKTLVSTIGGVLDLFMGENFPTPTGQIMEKYSRLLPYLYLF